MKQMRKLSLALVGLGLWFALPTVVDAQTFCYDCNVDTATCFKDADIGFDTCTEKNFSDGSKSCKLEGTFCEATAMLLPSNLTPDGSVRFASAGPTGIGPQTDEFRLSNSDGAELGSTPSAMLHELQQRRCDGAIIARRYSEVIALEVRQRSARLTI
jgi:hypothetical protein